MNALLVKGTWREVSFLVLLLFQIPPGVTHILFEFPGSLGKHSAPNGKRRDAGPKPHGQGGDEQRLLWVWAATLFSPLPKYVTRVYRNHPGATHWPLVRFHFLFPITMTSSCQLLLIFLTVFYRLGALRLHAAGECWKWPGLENTSVGNGGPPRGRNRSSDCEINRSCMLQDFRLSDISFIVSSFPIITSGHFLLIVPQGITLRLKCFLFSVRWSRG